MVMQHDYKDMILILDVVLRCRYIDVDQVYFTIDMIHSLYLSIDMVRHSGSYINDTTICCVRIYTHIFFRFGLI